MFGFCMATASTDHHQNNITNLIGNITTATTANNSSDNSVSRCPIHSISTNKQSNNEHEPVGTDEPHNREQRRRKR